MTNLDSKNNKQIRTRFAPSPTGFMHVGGVRTALFAWLFARSTNGKFILRIEDTDQNRKIEGSIEHIIESLNWLGLDRDEGPQAGGEFGPYLQSERLEIYKKYAQQLIDEGLAYADPFSKQQVDDFREISKASKKPFLFREYRPESTETAPDWYGKQSIRFKVPHIKRYEWIDEVRGRLSAGEEALDDFVIMKADGYPTYNFAHVIDDFEMKISHIIRGEEFLPSTPKYLSLYEALKIEPPKLVTVPQILNSEGNKKLSKRDGAKDVLAYREEGYTPEAINNFLASLGWNDGTKQEIYSIKELIEAFSIKRIQRSGAKFDETKLAWISWQHHSRAITADPTSYLSQLGFTDDEINPDFAQLALSKSRSLEDFKSQYKIYCESRFISVSNFDLSQIDDNLDPETAVNYLKSALQAIDSIDDFSAANIEEVLRNTMSELEAKPRAFLNLIRWAITNSKVSPNLFDMISIIGKSEVLNRIIKSIES